jgi:hypothetical protein
MTGNTLNAISIDRIRPVAFLHKQPIEVSRRPADTVAKWKRGGLQSLQRGFDSLSCQRSAGFVDGLRMLALQEP